MKSNKFIVLILLFPLLIQVSYAQTLKLWQDSKIRDFVFTKKGTLVYAATGKTVSSYNFLTNKECEKIEFKLDISNMDLSADSSALAVILADSSIAVWNLNQNRFSYDVKAVHAFPNIVRFSADGKYLVAGLRNGELMIINNMNGTVINSMQAHTGQVSGIDFSPATGNMASSGEDGYVCIWDLSNNLLLDKKHLHNDLVRNVIFNSLGTQLYSCGDDGSVCSIKMKSNQMGMSQSIYHRYLNRWILYMDTKSNNALAISNLSGKIKIFVNEERLYSVNSHSRVYKMKFYTNDDARIILGIAGKKGFQLLNANTFKMKTLN